MLPPSVIFYCVLPFFFSLAIGFGGGGRVCVGVGVFVGFFWGFF